MSDLVERLRACPGVKYAADPECNCGEAADEIERLNGCIVTGMAQLRALRDEVKRLQVALEDIVMGCDARKGYADRGHQWAADRARRALEGK